MRSDGSSRVVTSVCVATFNGEAYIEEQLASILCSPLVDEVLVSDDGSSDRTLQRIGTVDDPRIRLLRGPGKGLVRNIEFLLGNAEGDFIFLADQDDVWLPQKAESMISALRQGSDVVLSDCIVVDQDLNVLQPSYFELTGSCTGLLKNVLKNSYLGCCMALNRRLLPRILPFPDSPPAHDWWIGLIAEMFGSVQMIREPLLLYRRHTGNASTASGRSNAPLTDRLWRRLHLVRCLLARWRAGAVDMRV